LLRIALRHTSFVATLAELGRNDALCRLIGIDKQEDVPGSWNISRFLDVLGQEPHFSELRRMFDTMIQRLGQAVPDLGRQTAGDSTALHARCKDGEKAVNAEIAQGLPQPSGARKEYTNDDGKVTKIVEWFGYKLHLLVDRTIDLRRFPPIPRATKKFERLYNGRTSVERVNARLKIFWGVDDGNITGSRRFHAMVGAVLIVHAAFATLLAVAPRREGTLGKLRLSPIQKALREKPATA
jgi:hypothetical protein